MTVALVFKSQAEYAAQFGRAEDTMAGLAATVKRINADTAGLYTRQGRWQALQTPKAAAISGVNRIVEVIEMMATADRTAAEEALESPEPPQTAETLAALAYAQALLVRRFTPGDMRILDELARAVRDGDAVRAQVLSDMAAEIEWSIDSLAKMETAERLRIQAIALRSSGDRKKALAALALLDGNGDTAGIDGKADIIELCVGQRAEAIVQAGGDDVMVGSFRLDWLTPTTGSKFSGPPYGATGTMAALGVFPPRTW